LEFFTAFEADRFNHSRTSPGAKHAAISHHPTGVGKKRLQQLRAPSGQNSRLDFDVMI